MRRVELPRVEDLTNQQQNILKVIESIAIYGGAGTGKTLVSIWRHILNYREKRGKSYLITFTHTLTYFLQEFAKFNYNLKENLK
jgi:KaiC/GvpD/RAD55 family RecA-like ATPase